MQKLIIFSTIGAILLITCFFVLNQNKEELIIFHAGSLTKPFDDLEKEFEKRNNIDVKREIAGSIATIRKITELGKKADIIASADYTLIEDMMYPEYANFCIKFAKNKIVIAYTNKSAYKDEINEKNWYEILKRDGIRFGFSNPNDDPCGYRSLMVIQLAEIYYKNDSIFDELIEKNSGIKSMERNGKFIIEVPPTAELNINTDKIAMRSAEIDLMATLETGDIDYLFIYRSVAYQHRYSGVYFIELPEEIDLSNPSFVDVYSKVVVNFSTGKIIEAKPIIYGITIPLNAQNKDNAINFLILLLNETGQKIFEENGQIPIVPAICDNIENLPIQLRKYVVEK